MSDTLIGILTGGLVSIIISGLAALYTRKKTKSEVSKNNAEKDEVIHNMYLEIIDEFRKERVAHKSEVDEFKLLVKELKQDNEECEYKHDVRELEVHLLKKQIDIQNWIKEKVFILDDHDLVVKAFRKKFSSISSVEFKAFNDNNEFLKEVEAHKPQILILDYYLGEMTADDIIKTIGYEPEIFIMSGDSSIRMKFKDTSMQFFSKDAQLEYVFKIAKAVLQHLKEKHQD